MYIPLYNKTTYTFLSSLLEIDDLIEIALINNLKSIAICDDNLYGAIEFIKKCYQNNINPIVGLDLNDRLLFAKNYLGYQNLLKLTSIKSERDLTDDDYIKYKDDIICIPLLDINLIYNDYFIPLNFNNNNNNNNNNKDIFINKLLYKNEKDYEILKYLELLRDNKTISDEYIDKINCYYQKIEKDSIAFSNTFVLANMCHIILPEFNLNLANYPLKDNINVENYLINLSYHGLKKRFSNKINDIYTNRLKYELDIIIKMGFANYFLVVYDFIKYAKNKDILVGPGRGSAASSLVSYCLGITDVDPVEYNLLFERFLNTERITMPDIDTDFPDIYRDEIIEYVKLKYGDKHVSNIITFGTMGAKLAIRDIGRVMNVNIQTIDKINKIIGSSKDSLIDIYNNNYKFQELIKSDNKLVKLFNVTSKIEGIKRHTSIHAAGIIISNLELDTIVPLIKDNSTNMYISGYEAKHLEELGLLKMDFLGIKNLTTIMEIISDIKKYENIDVNFNAISLDDIKTIQIFQNADTNGIFQFESIGMKNFLKELKPNNFIDISNAIALFRPGPANNIPSFIKRKNGIEKIDYFDSSLENILKETYGIIIYQEQIIQIACKVAGYTLGQADILRRAMSKKKKDILLNEEKKFIEGAILNGYKKELASKIYQLILQFASYGFNKSHSISYTLIAYKMAYLKAHFPSYFYLNLLNSVISDSLKTKEYIYEMKKYNLKVLKPDINISNCTYQIVNNDIIAPFSIIKGISNIICSKIIDNRENKYLDIFDFFAKMNNLNKNIYEVLIQSGSLDSFGLTRKTMIYNLDNLINYSILCKDLESEFVLKPDLVIKDEFDQKELAFKEKEIYGFYLTNHPVIKYKVKYNNIVNLNEIKSYFNSLVEMILLVDKTREITTKKGDKMLFFSGSDEEEMCDFTIFPKEYMKYNNIKPGDILKVLGKIEKRNGNYQIIVSKIEKIE